MPALRDQLTHRCSRVVWTLSLLAFVSSMTGCSREWYREQADEDAANLIAEKSYAQWDVPYHGIDMDSRSRFFDAWDKVRPPMPQDDPESHRLMHHVDGMEGWDHWHDDGNIIDLENPDWKSQLADYVTLSEDGKIELKLEDAVRLALIHSPSYQQTIETLYFSAIDVSSERFNFDVQFFGNSGSGGSRFFNQTQSNLRGSETSNGNDFEVGVGSGIELRQQFATAGQLVAGFANTFVWQLSGSNSNMASSLINFSFIQPLLRAGGRQIALETLTIAERTLLANLRAFAFYRQGFFTQIAIGENRASRPSRRGGFLGGAGLSGFTGQGAGGFGGVGDATGFGRGGGTGGTGSGGVVSGSGFAGGGAGQVGGFIGLLQAYQQIRNTETSLAGQLQTLQLLEAHLEAGLIDIAQVDQFRQSIETERANLLQSKNGLETSLESFKAFTLGLPPDIPMELNDDLIRQFQFVDPRTQDIQRKLNKAVDEFGQLAALPSIEQLRKVLETLENLSIDVATQITAVEADYKKLQALQPERIKQYEVPAERRLFEKDIQQLESNLTTVRANFDQSAAELKKLKTKLTDATKQATTNAVVAYNVDLNNLLAELTLIQARIRTETVTLDAIDLDSDTALEIARANRLDWMNNRANLVDSWRLIEFNANKLESNAEIFLDGKMGTVGNNGVKFSGETGELNAGFRFDTPITRLEERNNFRSQLIFYQQARRSMIQYEDTINQGLRALLRDLKQLEVNLEIQRRAVAIAIRRADQTRETLNKPTPPALPGAGPAQFGPTAALNLLTALSDLRSSQNNFMSVWLNYYAGRMILMQSLGIMRIDERGMWIEETIEDALRMTQLEMPLPPSVPGEWMNALGEDKIGNGGLALPQNGDGAQQNGAQERGQRGDNRGGNNRGAPLRLPPPVEPAIKAAPPADPFDGAEAGLDRPPIPEINIDRSELERSAQTQTTQTTQRRTPVSSEIRKAPRRVGGLQRGPLPEPIRLPNRNTLRGRSIHESPQASQPAKLNRRNTGNLIKQVPLIQIPPVEPAKPTGGLDEASYESVAPVKRRSPKKSWRPTN